MKPFFMLYKIISIHSIVTQTINLLLKTQIWKIGVYQMDKIIHSYILLTSNFAAF